MKMTKLLAVLLAILMVIPVVVVPTSAESTATTTATSDPYTVTHEFTVYGDDETPYLVQHGGGSITNASVEWRGRNGENSGTIWKFPLNNPSATVDNVINKPEKFTITAKTRCELVMYLSLDGSTWTEVYSVLTDPDLTVTSNTALTGANYLYTNQGLGCHIRTYDFTDELIDLLKDNPEAENVYLKLGDIAKDTTSTVNGHVGLDGYGGAFIMTSPVKVEINYSEDTYMKYEKWTFTPGASDESSYLYGAVRPYSNESCFYLDEKNLTPGSTYIQYVYELTDSALPEKLTWTASVGQNLKLEFSADNFTWVEIFNEKPGDASNLRYYTFDITEKYVAAAGAKALTATRNSSMLHICLKNSDPGKNYGGRIDKKPVTLIAYYGEQKISGNAITFDWTVGDETSTSLYYIGGASENQLSNGYYYTDGIAKGVMSYPLINADASTEILWSAWVTSAFQLDVSLDNSHWVTAFRVNNTGVHAGKADHSTSVKFFNKYRTFDLTYAVKEAAKVATSKDKLYVRFGDSHTYLINADGTENTAKTSGWGGQLRGTVNLSVRLSEEIGCVAPLRQDIVTGPLAQHSDGVNYAFGGDVSTVLPWGDYRGGQFWHTFNKGDVDTTDPSNPVLKGTMGSNNTVWYADNSYFTLRYELPAGVDTWQFTATLGNELGIYYVYTTDKTTPHPINDFAAYKNNMLYNYVDNNGGARPSATMTFSGKATDEIYQNGGYLQLLFVDYSWWRANVLKDGFVDTAATLGYGPKIAIGNKYPITLSGVITIEDALDSVGMNSIALNLTEDFNLIYDPAIPFASSDTVVKIGFEGETMTEIAPEADGTYRFNGILPERMGDTVKFSMAGTIAGVTPFNYEVDYSVKQYCTNMLKEKAGDETFCALLRDILSYGAAAQTYRGYKTDALVNDSITDREFKNSGLSGVYVGEPKGDSWRTARWKSATLMLDTITIVKFTFAAPDVTNVTAIVQRNSGEKLVFTANDFTSEGTDAETGENLWSISIPVPAYEYNVGLIAAFTLPGMISPNMDHYVAYSVNTYIAKQYGQLGDAQLDALLGAIYNYGQSTAAYVAARNN